MPKLNSRKELYPLNLVLSYAAAIQAPLIMMRQNRREEKDRRRAENDYNLKTEIMVEDLYDKVNTVLAKQSALEKRLTKKNKPAKDIAVQESDKDK